MAQDDTTRRLAAIVALDVAGYSRLMGRDEAGTLERLKAHRAAIDPIGDAHGGRIVGSAGDGVLWEFPSVVEAVAAAIEFQAAMAARNADVSAAEQMRLRIGINLGDVLVDGDDIFGDGVNVAARIEALAPPGGICLSRAARDQIRDRMDVALEDLGEIAVKNIARPVRVFRILADGEVATPPRQSTAWPRYAAAASVLLAILAVAGAWWWQQRPDFTPADPAKFAYTLPDKPSIAVLPFANLTGDASQDWIGDGLTENLIAVLATVPEVFVIARSSSFTYKGNATNVQLVAEELGVRYVLEGSVHKSGEKLRVTAQLIDALSGRHLWAERYDRTLDDVFAVFDDIALRIQDELQVKLTLGEQTRIYREATRTPENFRLAIQGRVAFQKMNRDGHLEAERLWRELYDRAPENANSLTLIGWLHWQKVALRISKDYGLDLKTACEFAEAALAKDELSSTHNLLALLDLWAQKHESAMAHADRAVELGPSEVDSHAIAGAAKVYGGDPAEGVELLKRAMRLEPDYPHWLPGDLAIGLRMLGRYAESKSVSQSVLTGRTDSGTPRFLALVNLAVIAVWEDELDKARTYVRQGLKLRPQWTIAASRTQGAFIKDRDFMERSYQAMRQAGVPENAPSKTSVKPAIAVLPFANLSDDKEQEYFADGMTDDLITDLSKLSGLIVIARNSVFTYKGRNVKVQEIAKDLNVTHVLEGSVRRAGDTVRINAQLIDGTTGAHLWSERYDGRLDDIFALQDRIAAAITGALKVKLTGTEQSRLAKVPTKSIEAHDKLVQARQAFYQYDDARIRQALDLFEEAITLDPAYADAYAWDGFVSGFVWSDSLDRILLGSVARQRAERSIARALALDPNQPIAMHARARLLLFDGRHDEAISWERRAVDLNPGSALSHIRQAFTLATAGQSDEARAALGLAMQLDPKPDLLGAATAAMTFAKIGDFPSAVPLFENVVARAPQSYIGHLGMVVSHAVLGRADKARLAMSALFRLVPSINVQSSRVYTRHEAEEPRKRWLEGMRKAGIPDWPRSFEGAPEHRLTGDQIKAVLFGRRMRGRSTFETFEWTIASDGRWEYRGTFSSTAGESRVEDDLYCARSDDLAMGREWCIPIFRNPDGSRESEDEYVLANIFDVFRFSIVD